MTPAFVSTLFSSNRNGDGPSTSTQSTSTSSSPNRSTLTSFRKFRASVNTSLSSSSTSIVDNQTNQEGSTPSKSVDLSASVPASYSYRYSVRSSTPLWGSMGSKLIKKSSSKSNLSSSSSTTAVSVCTPFVHDRSSNDSPDDRNLVIEEEDCQGTITRASLRRTLSRLSLNAPTITGRQARERMFTSSSYRSSSSSSPRLGHTANTSTATGKESPRVWSQFKLPRLQSFSPRLRLDLSDDENDNGQERKSLKSSVSSSSKGRSTRSTASNCGAISTSIPSTPIRSSPITRFESSSSTQSSNTANTDDTRYNELANLISIIELNPPQARSPRISAPNTPPLISKKSSFSLRRSTTKLKSVTISPIISHPSTLSKDSLDTGLAAEKAVYPATVQPEKTKTRRNRLIKPSKHPVDVRSYSFPPPSIIPPPSEQARLKSSKSLNDLLSTHTNILLKKRLSIVSSQYSSGATCVSYSEESMIESSYPALCTPPRTPRSRHASIEWFVDFIANEDEKVYTGVQEIACDESTLMPDILGPPISLVSDRGWLEKAGVSLGGGEEGNDNKRSSEAFDSLMDLIDFFPSPNIISTSTFSSSSKQSSPNCSIWSFQHTVTSSNSYSPSSTALVTPASEVGVTVHTPASSYFCHTPGHGSNVNVGDKEGYGIEDEEGRGKEKGLVEQVNANVLASHRALTEVLSGDCLKRTE